LAAAVVQLDGSVLIWHMMDWFLTACCLYGARLKMKIPTALFSLFSLFALFFSLVVLLHW
jgi:hypothetical protein